MKRILFFFTVLSLSLFANTQEDVVFWTTTFNDRTSEIEMKAEVSDGWHIYSQFVSADLGPIPTSFSFEKSTAFSLIGDVHEPKAMHQIDPNFETAVEYFKNEVTFKQKIKTIQSSNLNGTITFMACNEVRCIPPSDEKFTIKITK